MKLFWLSAVLLLSGCLNLSPDEDPTRFYVLGAAHERVHLSDQKHLAIRSVSLADYVDNSKIVERVSGNEINYLALHRWGGHLDGLIGQVVADEIERTEAGIYATVGPAGKADWQMDLNVLRFDRLSGGGAEVVFEWVIQESASKTIVGRGRSAEREMNVKGSVEQSVVQMGTLLRKGVRELVGTLEL